MTLRPGLTLRKDQRTSGRSMYLEKVSVPRRGYLHIVPWHCLGSL